MPIEGRRNAPNAAPAFAKLCLFLVAIFDQPIGRVCHDGMDGAWLAIGKPFKTIRQNELGFSGANCTRARPDPPIFNGCRAPTLLTEPSVELRLPLSR